MSDAQENQGYAPSDAEEEKQDAEALNVPTEDEVREEVVSKFGLNEDSQSELVNKLVEDVLEQRKALGKAIRQKQDWRAKATTATPKGDDDDTPPAKTDDGGSGGNENKPTQVPSLIDQAKEFKAIQDLDERQISYIETISKAKGISLSEAKGSDEFKFWNESYTRKVEEENTKPTPSSKQPSNEFSDVANMTVQEVLALPPNDKRREEWSKMQKEKLR